MTRTRTTIAALLASAALALTGCAGGAEPVATTEQEPAATAPTASEGGADSSPGAATGGELIAMVGTADDPEAYEIALLDADGQPVASLPAGDYSLTFVDRSRMHNFHLTGPGDVDVATDVAGSDESTVEVTLVPGTYTFVCDPHVGTMSGEVEVTG